jgi:hypothetical protein
VVIGQHVSFDDLAGVIKSKFEDGDQIISKRPRRGVWELITQDTTALELVKLNTIANPCLQHLRRIPAPCTTRIIHVARNLLWTLGCKLIEPIDELGC